MASTKLYDSKNRAKYPARSLFAGRDLLRIFVIARSEATKRSHEIASLRSQ
jgi:hypothetical protein